MNKIFFLCLTFTFQSRFLSVSSLNNDLLNKTIASSLPRASLLANAIDSNKFKQKNITINFDLKLIRVDLTSAQFEIEDDNKTTINYAISYTVKTQSNALSNQQISESATFTKLFEMQTNSIYLMNKQEELLKNMTNSGIDSPIEDNGEKMDSGEKYNSAEKLEIKSKTWQEVHRFLVGELESDRLYEINFEITARLAHLSNSILREASNLSNKKYKETKKSFKFLLQTTFDVEKKAEQACQISKSNSNKKQSIASSASCYLTDNDCSRCKITCYKRDFFKNVSVPDDSTKKDLISKPILCEPCPCDQSKSTGECLVVNSNNFQPPQIKCKQCIIPYTGDQCNNCEGEGIDYYKNEDGTCVKCECNNNAYMDSLKDGTKNVNSKKKCSPITGMCNDCMFNTTGKHCHECKSGFKGDALKRTCLPFTKETIHSNITINSPKSGNHSLDSEHGKEITRYSHLALFSIYIFSILFIILFAYFCVSYQSQHSGILKDVHFSSSFCACGSLFSSKTYTNMLQNLNDSTRHQRSRISFYLAYICPFNVNKLRSTNLTSGTNVTNPNCIYTGAQTNTPDDDRLGLAEYQVFDDSLLNDENNVYIYKNTSKNKANSTNVFDLSDNDDVKSSNKNPYQSLTIKS